MTPIAPHISAFLREHLPRQRGASAHTCDSYAYSFQLLFEYAGRRFGVTPSALSLEQIDAPLVMDFLVSLESERGNSPSARNARLAAIKSFMRFVEYRVPALLEQIRRVRAIPTKKTDQPLIRHLSMMEIQAVLNAPDLRTRCGIRDRAMLHVCFAAGLRGVGAHRVAVDGSASTANAHPSYPGQRPSASSIAAVETNGRGCTSMVGCPWRGAGTGAVRQRSRSSDDSCWLRLHFVQVRATGSERLSLLSRQTRLAPCLTSLVRDDDLPGYR